MAAEQYSSALTQAPISRLLRVSSDEELRRAADLQRALLPPCFHVGPAVELAAALRPCRAMSGDFFDYTETGREFRVALGDVCGKGAPAALQAAVVQGVLAIESEADGGPAHIIERLNRTLCRRTVQGTFVTVFYAIIADRRLTYCNAGHCRPILMTDHGAQRLATGGLPAGLFPTARYKEATVDVHNGDTLLVFSDGVTEASNAAAAQYEDFGDHRLLEMIRAHWRESARTLLDRLLGDLRAFTRGGPQQDDITALVVRCRA